MISSLIDLILIAALAVTSSCVLLMYRRLRRFDALQGDAAKAFAAASDALEQARRALASLQTDGDVMAVALAGRLNEARLVLNDLDDAFQREQAIASASAPAPAAPPTYAPIVDAPARSGGPIVMHAASGAGEHLVDSASGATPWVPPSAKSARRLRTVAADARARRDAAASLSPDDLWSTLTVSTRTPTQH